MNKTMAKTRVGLTVRGAVQGVGFRPTVYRHASELALAGWVVNAADGVHIEVEGEPGAVEEFCRRVREEAPPHAIIDSIDQHDLEPTGETAFEIRESEGGEARALILPELATCPECRRELFDKQDRRHRYPFLNCTHCGPRFTIVNRLPYDRPNTTMAGFELCPDCRAEYENPLDRRFHAQPIACPACGPQLELRARDGERISEKDDALLDAEEAIRQGKIVAVKGLGGFHLICDARSDNAVQRLRERKRREEKPLAIMALDLDWVHKIARVDKVEEQALTSRESPIVLLEKLPDTDEVLSPSLAPNGNPRIGVMLPYSPLHLLLLDDLGFPVVATSGNLSDEPICFDTDEAVNRLSEIADLFLVHDRPIARHVDDSVVRVVEGEVRILRRARGYAPLPVKLPRPLQRTLAVGAHLKNTVALAVGQDAFISQHIGDLETAPAHSAFREVIGQFESLYESPPALIAHDEHPDYLSTQWAIERGGPHIALQHHAAHIYACMAEHEISEPVLGLSWDGTGYGLDGTVWGGECIEVKGQFWKRTASLRLFPLPGGETAIRQPRRTALGLLAEACGVERAIEMTELKPVQAFSGEELTLIRKALEKGINSPRASSIGRLFDAVSSLCGLRQTMSFEGQAAMELEWAVDDTETGEYTIPLSDSGDRTQTPRYDWRPMLESILEDLRAGVSAGAISARFHHALAGMAVDAAKRAGIERVALSGGCFQNAYLTTQTTRRLREAGFTPLLHRLVPPNDGGIALGQLYAAALQKSGG